MSYLAGRSKGSLAPLDAALRDLEVANLHGNPPGIVSQHGGQVAPYQLPAGSVLGADAVKAHPGVGGARVTLTPAASSMTSMGLATNPPRGIATAPSSMVSTVVSPSIAS